MTCLECRSPLTPSPRGMPRRYCSPVCQKTFENRRRMRGALLYDLMYAHRVERAASQELGLWNAMCQLIIRWREDDGTPKYKPPAMALADIEAMDRPPTKNLYLRPPMERSLGHFTDEVMAAQAYDRAARELHGAFAVLNFPEAQ